MRTVYLQKNRQKKFNLSFHINDTPLPTYDAYKDPFLKGFFKAERMYKILKTERQKKKSRNKYTSISEATRPKTTQKLKDLFVQEKNEQEQLLPILQNVLTEQAKRQSKTDEYTRVRKKYYRSRTKKKSSIM